MSRVAGARRRDATRRSYSEFAALENPLFLLPHCPRFWRCCKCFKAPTSDAPGSSSLTDGARTNSIRRFEIFKLSDTRASSRLGRQKLSTRQFPPFCQNPDVRFWKIVATVVSCPLFSAQRLSSPIFRILCPTAEWTENISDDWTKQHRRGRWNSVGGNERERHGHSGSDCV